MKTDNVVTAFRQCMVKRLGESPAASRRGKHRVAFLALRPLIEDALVHGYTMKGTWAALREQGRLSMSYQAFRNCQFAGSRDHLRGWICSLMGPPDLQGHGTTP